MAVGWAPYHDGHWAWVDPWGWVPGPVRTRAYYAPALVAFVGGSNFQLTISSGNVGGVAWFPLAPREVYRPPYTASRSYFENINRSNTVINNTVIKNTYNTTNVTNVVYANRQVPGAVIAVPRTAFVQSQPVARAAVRVSQKVVASTPVAVIAPLAPTERSSRWAVKSEGKPPARVFERSVVARTAPPAVHPGYVAQPAPSSEKSGKPLDDAARKPWKPAVAAAVPSIKVLDPAQLAIPTARPPPPVAPTAKPAEARNLADWSKPSAVPAVPVAPAPQSKVAVQPQPSNWRNTPPAVPPASDAPHGKWGPRDSSEPRTPAVAPPQGAVPAAPVTRPAPPAWHPAPAAKPEPAAAVRPAEPGAPVAAPRPLPPQTAPQADPHAQKPKPDGRKPGDGKNDNEDPKR